VLLPLVPVRIICPTRYHQIYAVVPGTSTAGMAYSWFPSWRKFQHFTAAILEASTASGHQGGSVVKIPGTSVWVTLVIASFKAAAMATAGGIRTNLVPALCTFKFSCTNSLASYNNYFYWPGAFSPNLPG